MSRSPTIIGTLLIFALCIVIEISSAPREKIDDSSKQEKFLVTREAELLELTRVARDARSHESREHEIERRMAKEPLPPAPTKEIVKQDATKKPVMDDKPKDDATSKPAASEAKDMTQSHVSPKDDDDDSTVAPTSSKVPEATEKNSSGDKQSTNETTPEGDKGNASNVTVDAHSSEAESEGKTPITTDPTNKVETTNATLATPKPTSAIPTSPTVVTSAPTVASSTPSTTITIPTSATVSTTTKTSTSASTTESTTTEKPTVTTSAPTEATTPPTTTTEKPVSTTTSSSTKSETTTPSNTEETSEGYNALHSKPAPSMPSGVVALITAIAFAIVAVIAYIGLVVWRRYLEWRYGNRELLVNEFDSNDIGNFEL